MSAPKLQTGSKLLGLVSKGAQKMKSNAQAAKEAAKDAMKSRKEDEPADAKTGAQGGEKREEGKLGSLGYAHVIRMVWK